MSRSRWTRQEIEILTSLYGTMPAREIAVRLGRTVQAITTAARENSLTRRPKAHSCPWTESDMAVLAELYHIEPAREIARRLGRTEQAVLHRANICGLSGTHGKIDDAFFADIRRLNAEGLSDAGIAQQLNRDRHSVSLHRKRLGLSSNQYGPRWREKILASQRRQLEEAGVSSLGEYRALMLKVRVIRSGWPEDLRYRCVQILDLLEREGPKTRKQIAEAIGMPSPGRRGEYLQSNERGGGGSYLSNLMRRGLVVCLGRTVYQGGPCRNVCLYSIALDARRNGTS